MTEAQTLIEAAFADRALLQNPLHRDAVLSELKRALSRDRTRITVNGFSQLGLVEMTRKRTR